MIDWPLSFPIMSQTVEQEVRVWNEDYIHQVLQPRIPKQRQIVRGAGKLKGPVGPFDCQLMKMEFNLSLVKKRWIPCTIALSMNTFRKYLWVEILQECCRI